VEDGVGTPLVSLSYTKNDEVLQDCARAFANLLSNEDTHLQLYHHGALGILVPAT
jgi:hypothetical protein